MNYLLIIRFVGSLFQFEGLFMLIPFIVGLIYHETEAKYLLLVAAIAALIGTLLKLIKPKNKKCPEQFYYPSKNIKKPE